MSIGSGSCGNCYYLGVGDYGILIDAGIPSKTIRAALKKEGIAFESICAMFVTHDHADHIKSLGVISSKANIPVYATREVHEGITKNGICEIYYKRGEHYLARYSDYSL